MEKSTETTGITAEAETGETKRTAISSLLKEGERTDDLERNGYVIIQDPGRFCFGMDAVLLSGFAGVKKGGRALDLGTGTGIIPILMEAKTEGAYFAGLELQAESADMAKRSVLLNGLEDRVEMIHGDIREAGNLFSPASFDTVTSNPPYMIDSHGLKNPGDAKAIARHEICCTLRDVVKAAALLLKTGGHFYMVHRPFRLPEIMSVMSELGLEPKRMRMVHPFIDSEPNMVLIEGVRGGRPRLLVEKPLIIFEGLSGEGNEKTYTREIRETYGY